jgi:hypothetical protein
MIQVRGFDLPISSLSENASDDILQGTKLRNQLAMVVSSTPSQKNIALISSHPFWPDQLIVTNFHFSSLTYMLAYIFYSVSCGVVVGPFTYGVRGGCYSVYFSYFGHLYLIDGCGLVGEDQRTKHCKTCFKEIWD